MRRTLLPLLALASLGALQEPSSRAAPEPCFSEHGWIEYVPGDAPLVLAAPHGGALSPASLRDRRHGVLLEDAHTAELAREIASAYRARTGRRPHLVICHLHRGKLDANREVGDAAQGDAGALSAWRAWHAFLEEAKARVTAEHGAGLVVDVHGHSHPEGRLEWGYALSRAELALPASELTLERLANPPSLRSLAARHGGALAPLLTGEASLGNLAEAAGYPSVPSTARPHPGAARYFDGGYNTRRHGSRRGGTIDAVQMEVPRHLRMERARRRRYARDVAGVLDEFLERWYGARHAFTACRPARGDRSAPGGRR